MPQLSQIILALISWGLGILSTLAFQFFQRKIKKGQDDAVHQHRVVAVEGRVDRLEDILLKGTGKAREVIEDSSNRNSQAKHQKGKSRNSKGGR